MPSLTRGCLLLGRPTRGSWCFQVYPSPPDFAGFTGASVSLGFSILGFGFWVLDFGFWVLDFGFWVLDLGHWVLDLRFGFRIQDFVFRILGLGFSGRCEPLK